MNKPTKPRRVSQAACMAKLRQERAEAKVRRIEFFVHDEDRAELTGYAGCLNVRRAQIEEIRNRKGPDSASHRGLEGAETY